MSPDSALVEVPEVQEKKSGSIDAVVTSVHGDYRQNSLDFVEMYINFAERLCDRYPETVSSLMGNEDAHAKFKQIRNEFLNAEMQFFKFELNPELPNLRYGYLGEVVDSLRKAQSFVDDYCKEEFHPGLYGGLDRVGKECLKNLFSYVSNDTGRIITFLESYIAEHSVSTTPSDEVCMVS